MDHDQLIDQHSRIATLAVALSDAAETLASQANGTSGRVMPAPTVYDLLGNLKLTFWALLEVTEFLPTGLVNSLYASAIKVSDQDCQTGALRDGKESVIEATRALTMLHELLDRAANCAEEGQTSLGGQGYAPS